MPVAMTFTSLRADMAAYTEKGVSLASDPDTYNQIPSLISLAEHRISRDLKIEGTQETVSSSLANGTCVYVKPTRWRGTISMTYGGGAAMHARTPIFARSYEYVRNYWPDDSLTSAPRFYADYDDAHWIISPTPDQAYPLEVLYHQLLPLLDDTNQTNWITIHAPQLLLPAAIHELALFVKNSDMAQQWDGKYQMALGALNGEDMKKMVDRSATRQGP